MTVQMDEKDLDKIVGQVQKILALGRQRDSETEAAAAMAKAQELLAKYNLDMAMVEKGPAEREKVGRDTGMYLYQRSLWRNVAQLNFCLCFRDVAMGTYRGKPKMRNQMFVVGRKANTRATIAMASYLEQVVDRLCRERLETHKHYGSLPGNRHNQFFSGWAVSFREGVADRLVDKVQKRRKVQLRKEEREAAALRKKMSANASSSTGISLNVYKDQETDANIDFLYGEGTAAEWASSRAEQAAAAEAAEREYTEWAKAHPEEARAEEEKQRRRRISYGRAPRDRNKDWGAYRAGQEAGEKVGIDPQTDDKRGAGRIAHG